MGAMSTSFPWLIKADPKNHLQFLIYKFLWEIYLVRILKIFNVKVSLIIDEKHPKTSDKENYLKCMFTFFYLISFRSETVLWLRSLCQIALLFFIQVRSNINCQSSVHLSVLNWFRKLPAFGAVYRFWITSRTKLLLNLLRIVVKLPHNRHLLVPLVSFVPPDGSSAWWIPSLILSTQYYSTPDIP